MDYTIAPLSEHAGAEVLGVDLSQRADEAAGTPLNCAFIERSTWKVSPACRKPKL
jgi:hypothetical protein